MTERIVQKLHLNRKPLLLTAVLLAIAAPVAIAQTNTADSEAKPQSIASPAAAPVFDVASIRQNNSDEHARSHIYSSPSDGHFKTINVPLKMLLQFTYGLPETQILGGPDWLKSEKFDIEAKADSSVDDQMRKLDPDQGKLQKQQMLQALLADRFKLTVHHETRELPIFALVVAKNGPTLQESKANGVVNRRNGQISVQGGDNSVAILADQLATQLGRVVVDKTGIKGRYDITLKWAPDDGSAPSFSGTGGASPSPEPSGPSIFTAIQEQLGLKLESQKGPVQVLVIDHVEKPSEN